MTNRTHFGWIWFVYAVLWGALRLVYISASRMYAPNLSVVWWLLVLLYFMADVLVVLALMLLRKRLSIDDPTHQPLWYIVSEIVPIWLLLHLSLLLMEYPVSARLEAVGLGKLQAIVVVITMTVGAGYVLRSIKSNKGPTVVPPFTSRLVAALIMACILCLGLLLAIPYFATRPLSPSQLLHAR